MTVALDPSQEPAAPAARGPLSAAILSALTAGPPPSLLPAPAAVSEHADPYGEDLQLALHVCYELHYRGLAGVDPVWEWDPDLLRLRAAMETAFETAVRADTTGADDRAALDAEFDALLTEHTDADSVRAT